MRRVLGAAIAASCVFCSSSCRAPSRADEKPYFEAFDFNLSKAGNYTKLTIVYYIPTKLVNIAEKHMNSSQFNLVYGTNFVLKAAPIADLNGDHIIDMKDISALIFLTGKYNNLVDLANEHLAEGHKFLRRQNFQNP